MVDPVSVLGTHLAELIRRYAHELFSRQDAKSLLDRVARGASEGGGGPGAQAAAARHRAAVLQNLLRERVSIRDAVSILEALGEAAASTRNPVLLTEYVRQAIRRAVVKPYLNRAGDLPAWFLDPAIEQAVESAVEHGEQNSHLTLAPQAIRDILNRIATRVASPETPVVAITSSRRALFPAADRGADPAEPVLPGAQRDSSRGCGCSRWGTSRSEGRRANGAALQKWADPDDRFHVRVRMRQ